MRAAIVMIPVLLILLSVQVFIGFFVYEDADRRGMNAVLWTLVAVFAPSLIGFIIYLLVRGNYSIMECPNCGEDIEENYVVCPNCGMKLKSSCPNCAAPVEKEWKVCPMCASPLPEQQENIAAPVRYRDKKLWKILAVIIIVPVVLILLALVGFRVTGVNGTNSTGIGELTFDEYKEEMLEELGEPVIYEMVEKWMESLEPEEKHAYALRYDYSSEAGGEHFYLIYVPGAGEQTDSGIVCSSGLSGETLSVNLRSTGQNDSLMNMIASGNEKAPKLKIKLDEKRIPCEVIEVDFNPTVFAIE